nr:lipid IV(A) 3-deoxy-D-manno-octulosonic acid transferase [Sulfurimonas sp. MAG313]
MWFHACSLGEAKALEPLIKDISKASVNISVITHTGFSAATSFKQAQVRYLPYELFMPFWQSKQRLLIVLEAELWYMLFLVAKSKGTKTVLLNARISDRSYSKYLKMRWFYSRLFKYIDLIFVQSKIDKQRFEALGARNLKVIGNIKLAQKVEVSRVYTKADGLTIVAGSTHEGEEKLIVEAFLDFKKVYKGQTRLIIVPRHPERFEAVHEEINTYAKDACLSYTRFSKDQNINKDLILVDTMGELNNLYAVSDIAILGGGFAPIGGHNPLEPIFFGCKLISGKHIFNQKELFKYVKHAQLIEDAQLSEALLKAIDLPASSIDEKVDLDEIKKLIKDFDYE